jgi:clostripain
MRDFSLSSKQSKLLFGILAVIVMLGLAAMSCSLSDEGTSGTDSEEATAIVESVENEDAAAASPAAVDEEPAAPKVNKGDTWTVMLYQDADDSVLEEDIFTDLNEAERIGSTDKVNIVAQIDRFKGGFKGKQNFTGAKRFYLTQDDDLAKISSEEVADLGEVNMADSQVLIDFVTWAAKAYPADRYILILSDHGTGWPGGWTDGDVESKPKDIQIDGWDDMLYLNELDDAFASIKEQTGIEKFDIIGYDACLMSSLEVLSMTAPYAEYAVMSQETEPSMGWAYTAFLKKLTSNSKIDSGDLAKSIVDTYISEDTLITDDEARANYVSRTYESTGTISANQLANEETKTVTLAAIDLSKIPAVIDSLDKLITPMSKINQKVVAGSRSHAKSYENVFGEDFPAPYIDLGNFVKLLQKDSTSEAVGTASQAVQAAIKKAVIAEKHGPSQKGSNGISIYFPNSKLFEAAGSDYKTYTDTVKRFAGESLWDDFLAFHYYGLEIKPNNKPAEDSVVTAPGASKITISPIELSGDTASTGNPVTLSTTIKGENVSYLYIFTGRFTKGQDQLQVVDLDYIDSEETKDIDGRIIPEWGEGDIPVDMDWEPVAYVVNDGTHKQMVLLEPDTFGAGTEDTLYTVNGIYKFANGEPDRYSILYFDGDGNLVKVMAFSSTENSGPQHEITPEQGDKFSILQQWIPMTDNGEESSTIYKESGILTFGDTPWTWEEHAAAKGQYLIGIIAEDMDGNTYAEYVPVTAE